VSAQLRRRKSTRIAEARASRRQSQQVTNEDADGDISRIDEEDEEPKKVEVVPGLTYTVQASKIDQYHKKLYRLHPKSRMDKKPPRTKEEEMAEHTISVVPPFTGEVKTRAAKKLEYVGRQLFAEIGFSQLRSREFWLTIFMLALCFWARLYTHYFGQWVFLQAIKIPVSDFKFGAVTVDLNYQATLMLTQEEVGVVCFGPIFVNATFLLLILTSWLSIKVIVSANPSVFFSIEFTVCPFRAHTTILPLILRLRGELMLFLIPS
jgi:hypothetical protein